MIPTAPSDEIGEFLDFLKQAVAPDSMPPHVGAPEEEIEQFARLARLPLPKLYLGYLREFGTKDPVLKMGDDCDTRVAALIELYREQAGQPDSEITPHGVVIAAGGLTGQRSLVYTEAAERGEGEPSVAVSWWGEVEYTCAATFRNHLYRQAFVRGRLARGERFRLFKNDERFLPAVVAFAAGLGFQPYWFSDDYQACLERPDGGVVYVASSPQTTVVEGCFADAGARDQLKTEFMRRLVLKDATAG